MSEEFEGTAKESKLMHWIEHSLAPKTRAFMARPWLSGFTNGIMKCLPFILTGCLIFFYNAIRSWITVLPDLGLIQTYTFSMLGLIYVFMIPHELMATLKHRKFMVTAGITGICVYMLTMAGVFDETGSYITIEFARFGPTGSMVAMLVGLEVAFVFNLWSKVRLFKKGSSVPTFVQEWINNIIPIFVCVLIQMLIVGIAQVDLYSTVLWLFSPIQAVAQSFPGFVLWNFIQTFFYTIGVSGWTWTGLCNSWQVPAMAENIASQLERRISFRRAMKGCIGRSMKLGAKGIKTKVSGRLGGAEIARSEEYHDGTIPLQTIRADIDYGFAEANTTYGRIGVKVWLYKGEVLNDNRGERREHNRRDDRRDDRRERRDRRPSGNREGGRR